MFAARAAKLAMWGEPAKGTKKASEDDSSAADSASEEATAGKPKKLDSQLKNLVRGMSVLSEYVLPPVGHAAVDPAITYYLCLYSWWCEAGGRAGRQRGQRWSSGARRESDGGW